MIYLALLRGINVGGKNQLPMKELVPMFEAAGAAAVRTYIQSGNVIFETSAKAFQRITRQVETEIFNRFSYRIPIISRSLEQLKAVLDHNPFTQQGVPEEYLHVTFLADVPTQELILKLDPRRSPPDVFMVRGREIYLNLPNGSGTTKLTNAYFEAKLETNSTGRNWRTVNKLFELMQK